MCAMHIHSVRNLNFLAARISRAHAPSTGLTATCGKEDEEQQNVGYPDRIIRSLMHEATFLPAFPLMKRRK